MYIEKMSKNELIQHIRKQEENDGKKDEGINLKVYYETLKSIPPQLAHVMNDSEFEKFVRIKYAEKLFEMNTRYTKNNIDEKIKNLKEQLEKNRLKVDNANKFIALIRSSVEQNKFDIKTINKRISDLKEAKNALEGVNTSKKNTKENKTQGQMILHTLKGGRIKKQLRIIEAVKDGLENNLSILAIASKQQVTPSTMNNHIKDFIDCGMVEKDEFGQYRWVGF